MAEWLGLVWPAGNTMTHKEGISSGECCKEPSNTRHVSKDWFNWKSKILKVEW